MVAAEDAIFAGNRATGHVALTAGLRDGRSRRARVYEDGSLRLRFPNARGLEAVIVNTAGGAAGGDRLSFDISVDAGASLTVTSAAAEKVYRSLGPDTTVALKVSVAAGASLCWVPQETILYDRARLSRMVDADVAEGGRVLLMEAVVFGRAAMGETVRHGRLIDRWRVRHAGRLIFAETLRLDGDVEDLLAQPAIGGGAVALATVLVLPGDEAAAERVRGRAMEYGGEVGVSAWNGLALVRLCADNAAALRRDLALVMTAVGGQALPRLWHN